MKKLKLTELNRLDPDQYKEAEKFPVVIVVDNIRSGHNVGSFFRTADGFRIEAIYLCGYSAKPPHPEIYKTALGAENIISWKYFSRTTEAVAELKSKGYIIVGIEQTTSSIPLQDMDFNQFGKLAVIAGNEVDGVSMEALEQCDIIAEIPQFGTKHSFNVSVAVGMVLWEIIRARIPT